MLNFLQQKDWLFLEKPKIESKIVILMSHTCCIHHLDRISAIINKMLANNPKRNIPKIPTRFSMICRHYFPVSENLCILLYDWGGCLLLLSLMSRFSSSNFLIMYSIVALKMSSIVVHTCLKINVVLKFFNWDY